MRIYVIEHRIYEEAAGPSYPVVTHQFRGRTREEAAGYYRAHLKSDAFFEACNSPRGGTFQGTVKCRGFVREFWEET